MDRIKYCYYKDIEIRFFDCDKSHRARISTIMKYIADIAGVDYTLKGYSHEWLWERGLVFLLSRVSIHINRMPLADEKLVVETWEKCIKGPLFYRDFNIYSQNGDKLIEASTAWLLANPQTRQILRPNQFVGTTQEHPEKSTNVLDVGKIKNKGELIEIGKRKVLYSDIDGNNHVYNAVYGDIACDYLQSDILDKEIQDFRINYKHEAVLGDEINISAHSQENKTYVCADVNGSACFECEFVFR